MKLQYQLLSAAMLALPMATQAADCTNGQTFDINGTCEIPSGVNTIHVRAWGAGGAGGRGINRDNDSCSGGGGGGAFAAADFAVTAGQPVTVTVGEGGAGGSSSLAGRTGGDSSVSYASTTRVLAKGGGGGAENSSVAAPGGSAADSIGDVRVSGGDGSAPSAINVNNCSSGAGGAGATSGSDTGGAGGAGLTNPDSKEGNPGQPPGGGGGGGRVDATDSTSAYAGGHGAAGRVILSWTVATTPLTVTASVVGGNGSVECAPNSVDPGGSSACHAVPNSGYRVSGWTGACASAGTSEYCYLTEIRSNQSSTVSFEPAAKPIPVLPLWGLGLLGLALSAAAWVRRR